MKRWKVYALCAACVCCMGVLTACGNRDNGTATEKEAETAAGETEQITENTAGTGNTANNNDTAGDLAGGTAVTDEGITDGGMADGNDGGSVNDVTDSDTGNGNATDGTGIGGAAEDIVDGVGEAGKDLVDGVENAGDALSGNGTAGQATG